MQFTIQENIGSRLASIFLKNSWSRSTVAAAILVCFLLIFQPFDYNLLAISVKLKIVALVGISTFFLCVVHQWLSGALARHLRVTLIHKVVLWGITILVISQLLFGYTIQTGMNEFSWAGSWQYFYASVFISLIPISLLRAIRWVAGSSNLATKAAIKRAEIKMNGERISLDDLIFLKAEDNYIRVYEQNKAPRLIRGSLGKAEKQINGQPHLMRVHRSYLINLECIEDIYGNSKNLKVRLSHHDQQVPVARSKSREFAQKISAQTGGPSAT